MTDGDELAHGHAGALVVQEGAERNENALGASTPPTDMEVLSVARTALSMGPICDACVGRCLADRSHGLPNRDRGSALKIAVALADDVPLDERMDDPCWVCEGITGRYDEFAERIVEEIGDREFDTYQVGTRPPAFVQENDRLLREEARRDPDAGEALKSEVNREVGKRLGQLTDTTVDFERPDIVALLDLEADRVELTVNSAFVFGRYRKLERGIPQTEWPCRRCNGSGEAAGGTCENCGGSGFLYDRSVEQLVAPAIESAMGGTDSTFHGAGREDVDARMVGTGRPFVVEVEEPRRRRPELAPLEERINESAEGAVEVEGLRLGTYEIVEHVKELPAGKTYEVTVSFGRPVKPADLEGAVAALDGATIEQRTPTRVAHRRADQTRRRRVYEAEVVDANEGGATLRIHGAGGLYIKELLTGDGGRTDPNLAGLLGVEVTVEALDVLAVEAEGDQTFADDRYLR